MAQCIDVDADIHVSMCIIVNVSQISSVNTLTEFNGNVGDGSIHAIVL